LWLKPGNSSGLGKSSQNELSKETNSERVLALADELGLALVQEQQALNKQKQEENSQSVPRPEINKRQHKEV
jgi:hypothetical protein